MQCFTHTFCFSSFWLKEIYLKLSIGVPVLNVYLKACIHYKLISTVSLLFHLAFWYLERKGFLKQHLHVSQTFKFTQLSV